MRLASINDSSLRYPAAARQNIATPFSPLSIRFLANRGMVAREERREREDKRTREQLPFFIHDSLSAPLQDPSMAMAEGPAQGSVATLGAVAARTRDALRPPYRLLRRIQQTIQHLTDRAVLPVERIGVHLDLPSSLDFSMHQVQKSASAYLLFWIALDGNRRYLDSRGPRHCFTFLRL